MIKEEENCYSLCFTKKSGDSFFLPYSWLVRCQFSKGQIYIEYTSGNVLVSGNGLVKIYQCLQTKAVREIVEDLDKSESEDNLFIDEITWISEG